MVESTQTFILKKEKNIFILMKFAWLQAGDIFFYKLQILSHIV